MVFTRLSNWILSWLGCLGTTRKEQTGQLTASAQPTSTSHDPSSSSPPVALEHLDRQPAGSTACWLLRLPNELILDITDSLPAADAVCLALTCKRMCYTLNVCYLARLLDSDATDSLLCRLERENTTGVSYCFPDKKLVRFTRFASCRPWRLHLHFHGTRETRESPAMRFAYNCFSLPYCTARLVTNHHILGPRHGLPASYLARVYDHLPGQRAPGVCWKETWTAKSINHELFLSCTHVFSHETADIGTFKTQFKRKNIGICSHTVLGIGRIGPNYIRYFINKIGTTEYYEVGWCQKCDTDWEVSVERADREHGWTVTIRTYHGLGTCRSPYDQKWQAISNESKTYRWLPPGAVKASWEESGNHMPIDQL